MIFNNKILGILFILTISVNIYGQRRKFTYSGRVRSEIDNSVLSKTDTLNADNINSGYALMDMAFNIAPNKVTDIKAAFRLNAPYGGFYGVGASVEFRELYIRGIIANAVKYQAGDFKYKMTPYTFYNTTEASNINEASVFSMKRNEVLYDNLMIGNKWWQQGANAETKLLFNKGINEIDIRGFLSRNRSSDYASTPEIIQAGADVNIIKNKLFTVGGNYINLFSVKKTAKTDVGFSNSVLTSNAEIKQEVNNIIFSIQGETGLSSMKYLNDNDAPNNINDYFYDVALKTNFKNLGIVLSAGYINVGPEFISAGAQTMRVDYNANPQLFPYKINTSNVRNINFVDLVSDASIYNVKISEKFSQIDYRYSNAMPYGKATPNRTGINADLSYKNKFTDASVNYANLSEISTYGTSDKRKFSIIKATANLYLNKLIGYKRNIKINVGYKNELTTRSGDTLQAINLNSSIIDLGFDIEVFNKFDVLTGIKMLNANGNEIISNRNNYNEIESYTPIKLNENHNLYGFGLRYRFSDRIYLSAYSHIFKLSDNENDVNNLEMNRLIILFSMQF